MKVIFLDFDGVISTFEKGWRLDEEKLTLLKEIVDETDAKIVVSSSWKRGYNNAVSFIESLYKKKRNEEIVKSDIFGWFAKNIYDITGNAAMRGDEVQNWIDEHYEDVENYVILDDDEDFNEEQLFNFVQTDSFEGITSREVKLCIKILNGIKIPNPLKLNLILTTRWRNMCSGVEENNGIKEKLHEYHNKFLI